MDSGMLTGKMMFAHPMQLQELLEAEGVRVVDDRVATEKKKRDKTHHLRKN
jgi:hypothetical protein